MKKALEKFYSNFIRDTQFSELMNKRIYNVLLIATKYDIFSLEEDGRIDEQIFNEYMNLSLRYPPRFTRVQNTYSGAYPFTFQQLIKHKNSL